MSILASLSWISQNCTDLGFDALALQALPLAERSAPELRSTVRLLAGYHHWQRGRRRPGSSPDGTCARGWGRHDADQPARRRTSCSSPIEMAAGDHARAFELMDATRAHFDDMESSTDVARILGGFAAFEAMAGRIDAARADSARALEIAQRAGNETVSRQRAQRSRLGAPARRSRRSACGRRAVPRDLPPHRRGARRRIRLDRTGSRASFAPRRRPWRAGVAPRCNRDRSRRRHAACRSCCPRIRAQSSLQSRSTRRCCDAHRSHRSWRDGAGRELSGQHADPQRAHPRTRAATRSVTSRRTCSSTAGPR